MILENWIRYTTLAVIMNIAVNLYAEGLLLVNKNKISTIDITSNTLAINVDRTSCKQGRLVGVLPLGITENFTHWTGSAVRTEIKHDETTPYFRMNIDTFDKSAQIYVQLSDIQPGKTYRIMTEIRNTTAAPLTLAIRMLPPPWKYFWSSTVPADNEWLKKEYVFRLKEKPDKPIGLFFMGGATGALDIRRISVEEYTTENATANHPSLNNYFRNSRLPLGLQAGWNAERDNFNGTIVADDNVKGPSGENTLKMSSPADTAVGLYSEPFSTGDTTHSHVVSFALKGSGNWTVAIVSKDPWKTLAQKNITASPEWQRISLPFMPDELSQGYALRIHGRGTVWLDAFRASISTSPQTEYVPGAPCEVALALPPSLLAKSRIQFDGEKTLVNYYVSGDCTNAVLKMTVYNVYGKAITLPAVKLDGNTRGTIDYLRFPDTPYGAFRLEAQVERNGQAISPWNEMIVTRIKAPKYWGKDSPASPFGIHVLPQDNSLDAVKAAGVNWIRLHDAGNYCNWEALEKEKGQWTFHDDKITAYRKHHLKIFAQLGTTPRWASYLGQQAGPVKHNYFNAFAQPRNIADYANYVKTVTARYRNSIDEYFIWNEPWMANFWHVAIKPDGQFDAGPHPAQDYANLMQTAYQAAKSGNPDVKISGFNTADKPEWTKKIYQSGGMNNCDMIDYHFYTEKPCGGPNDDAQVTFKIALGYIFSQEHGKITKPVYMSEGQGNAAELSALNDTPSDAGMYIHAITGKPVGEYHQRADNASRYVISHLSLGIKRIFLYSAHAYLNLTRPAPFVQLLGPDGYPSPMLAAYSAMTGRLEDKQFIQRKDLKPGLSAYVFSDGTNSTAAIFGPLANKDTTVLCTHAGTAWADLYGNPLNAPVTYKGRLVYADIKGNSTALLNALSCK